LKILRLRLKNIHSLKGEMLIDFTLEPLASAGLFAITGVTGAGKSTILDVITLALFNKIPRFTAGSTRTISKNDIEGFGSVVTHHCDDAYAEIEYQTGDNQYRSTWSIKKNRNGNFNDYEMRIVDLSTNAILDLKKSEVPDKNEALLGLTYDQFIKAVVLSQGDFARLLKSNDTDRAKLLEDITGSQIYRKIGSKIFEQTRDKEKELEVLHAEMKNIEWIPDEEVALKQEVIEQNKSTGEQLSKTIDTLKVELINIDRKMELLEKIKINKNEKEALAQRKEAFETKRIGLEKHTLLNPYREQFNTWILNADNLNQLTNTIKDLEEKISRYKITQINILEAIKKLIRETVSPEIALNSLKSFEVRVLELQALRESIKNQGRQERENLDDFIKRNTSYIPQDVLSHKHPNVLMPAIVNRVAALMSTPLPMDGNIEKLTHSLEQVQSEIKIQERLIGKAEQYETLAKDIEEIDKWMEDNQKELELLPKTIASYQSSIQSMDKRLEEIAIDKEKWLAIASMDDHRNKLVEGEPCPLCGADHHPYAIDLPAKKVLDHELELKKIKNEKLDIEDALKKANQKKVDLDINHNIRLNRKQESLQKVESIKSDLQDNLSVTVLKDLISKMEEQETIYKEAIKKTQTLHILQDMEKIAIRLNEKMEEYNNKDAAFKELYSGHDIKVESQSLQDQLIQIRDSILVTQTNLKSNNDTYKSLIAKQEQLTASLKDDVKKLGYDSIATAQQAILLDQDVQEWTSEKAEILLIEQDLKTKNNNLVSELNRYENVIVTADHKNDIEKSIGQFTTEHTNLMLETGKLTKELEKSNEQKNKFKAKQLNIDKFIQDTDPLFKLNHLIGDKEGNKYAKFAQNLNLSHLIQLTNLRLQKLTDRYTLKNTEITQDFKIIDRYQMDTVRSVKTLSGGETFIVSLALALSLSDMAAKNVRLDSLFIDEGFGSLDQESLEVALTTLEKLQSENNRSIGIISHVESLKERINTQIRVNKNGQGYSLIEIV
jgi:exonuclease SbcC